MTQIELRNKIVDLSRLSTLSNTNNRKEIQELVDKLEEWYINNRPKNELEMTKQSWKNIWYDDIDIGDRYGFKLNQDKIWQVIRKDYYYNVSQTSFGCCLYFTNYLQGKYTISNIATLGEIRKGLNCIDLTFSYNGIRSDELNPGTNVSQLVDNVENKSLCYLEKNAISIPGPIGVKGKLWNVYLDEEYRFACGFDKSKPEVIDLYIMENNNIIE